MVRQNLCLKQSGNIVISNESADLTFDVRSADYFFRKKMYTIEFADLLKLNAAITLFNIEI